MTGKRPGLPLARWGGPDKTNASMILNDSLGHKASPAARPQLCERCGRRPVELLVIGEREGMAVWICRECRQPRRFPMILARRRGRYRR